MCVRVSLPWYVPLTLSSATDVCSMINVNMYRGKLCIMAHVLLSFVNSYIYSKLLCVDLMSEQ